MGFLGHVHSFHFRSFCMLTTIQHWRVPIYIATNQKNFNVRAMKCHVQTIWNSRSLPYWQSCWRCLRLPTHSSACHMVTCRHNLPWQGSLKVGSYGATWCLNNYVQSIHCTAPQHSGATAHREAENLQQLLVFLQQRTVEENVHIKELKKCHIS